VGIGGNLLADLEIFVTEPLEFLFQNCTNNIHIRIVLLNANTSYDRMRQMRQLPW